ncbi:MAG: glutamate--tRNA ligase [Nitrososphaeria archaeon]
MSFSEDVVELIRKDCLINAVKHSGKCNSQAVLGKVLGEKPSLKANIKELVSIVNKVVSEVNQMDLDSQRKELSKYSIEEEVPPAQREEKKLPPLPDAEKYDVIVTRFAPNPDCVLHLGSARAIILSHDYARIYKGKFILRFEDTDPRLKKASLPFYQSIRDDLKWLNCYWDEEYIQSDRLEIYYEYARKLVEVGGAYVCTCRDDFKKKLLKRKGCPCRSLSPEQHLLRFDKMLNGSYKQGSAVLRVKTDIDHPNPAVRDWPALRIVDTSAHPHVRVGSKYRVWPLYNFAAGVDDHLMGMTHIIRGKEHYTNMIRQKYMYDHLGWKYPTAIHYGRLKIEGGVLSKSKIMQGISKGLYKGFDDPRLATFQALRRRGVLPQAIRQIIYDVNIKPVDGTISWDILYSINRKLIDKSSPRYFVVFDPVVLRISGLDKAKDVLLRKHPEFESMGYRKVRLSPTKDGLLDVLIKKNDADTVGQHVVFRLMGFANISDFKAVDRGFTGKVHSYDMDTARSLEAPLIHWVPKDDNIRVKLVDQNGQILEGFGERGLLDEPIGSMVQLEREGFARVDSKEQGFVLLYFTSK